jgi:hypothetical protein
MGAVKEKKEPTVIGDQSSAEIREFPSDLALALKLRAERSWLTTVGRPVAAVSHHLLKSVLLNPEAGRAGCAGEA